MVVGNVFVVEYININVCIQSHVHLYFTTILDYIICCKRTVCSVLYCCFLL